MTINEVFSDVRASFINWHGFFKDPNYSRTRDAVTWPEAGAFVVPELLTVKRLQNLSERRQFSFRVSDDDSIIQLGYRFNRNGDLVEARLAFYKLPNPEGFGDATVEPLNEGANQELISWLRMDFTTTVPAQVGHSPCHLHLSGLPSTRFTVFGVPSPAQFIEFIISHFYPNHYKTVRLSPDGLFETYEKINKINEGCTRVGTEPIELLRCLPHFQIPGN